MAASRVWQKRDAQITNGLEKLYGNQRPKTYWDLDQNATTFIIVDEGADHSGTFNEMLTQIMSTLANEVPSIAIKTGFSQKRSLSAKSALTLDSAVDIAMSGTPVLFLDIRQRDPLPRTPEEPSAPAERKAATIGIWANLVKGVKGAKDAIVGQAPAAVAPNNDGDVEEGKGTERKDEKSPREKMSVREKSVREKQHAQRTQLIKGAKKAYLRLNKDLGKHIDDQGAALVETFDACTLAFFHEAAVGDGDSSTAELNYGRRAVSSEGSSHKTLYESINELEAMRENGEDLICDPSDPSTIPPASQLEISALSAWLAKRIFRDAWRALPKSERKKIIIKREKEKAAFFERGHAMSTPKASRKLNEKPQVFRMSMGAGSDGEDVSDDEAERKIDKYSTPPADMFREERYAFQNQATTLLASQDFYHLNLREDKDSTKLAMMLMKKLVKLDRLPSSNSLEGCKLLQRAWCIYDVSMLLATRYKVLYKVLFITQLLCGWLAVAAASFSQVIRSNRLVELEPDEQDKYASMLVDVAFGMSVAGSVLSALDGILKAKSRWRELRRTANAIESVVWQFRTRTGLYTLPEHQTKRRTEPKNVLEQTLQELSKELVSGNAVTTADLAKRYPLNVYKHGQFQHDKHYQAPSLWKRLVRGVKWLFGLCGLCGKQVSATRRIFEAFDQNKDKGIDRNELMMLVKSHGIEKDWSIDQVREIFDRFDSSKDGRLDINEFSKVVKVLFPQDNWYIQAIDDFQSPASAPRYIELRVNPQIVLYQRRIPAATRRELFCRVMIVLLGTLAAVLAHIDIVWCVVLATAASGSIATWQEFSGYDKKGQKYTRAVAGLNDVLTWWWSLSEFEQASKYQIEALISKAEAVIAEEQGTSKWANPGRAKQEREAEHERNHHHEHNDDRIDDDMASNALLLMGGEGG